MPIGIKPIVDFVFKKIFGSPENAVALIGLLNAILDLEEPIVGVEILNPFSYQEFVDAKLVVLDVRARDSTGRSLNIEMQLSTHPYLQERLTYYACGMYVDQLEAGGAFTTLRPALSICLLSRILYAESQQAHHRFQLIDRASGREISGGIEVHTVELTKYNLRRSTVGSARAIHQWAFFLLCADQYEVAALRELLPSIEFQQAITVIESIAQKTEDRIMYDQRTKAQMDYDWAIEGARNEGLEQGLEQGLERGIERGALVGKIQLLQQLLDEQQSPISAFANHSPGELSELLNKLQNRLRLRDT